MPYGIHFHSLWRMPFMSVSYTLDTPALKQKVEKRRNPRIIYVGLSWNFGGEGKKQHHNVEYDEEM